MAKLSPQAQAVLEAYWHAVLDPMSSQTRPGGALVAAALRALADQRDPLLGVVWESDILAIAVELECAND